VTELAAREAVPGPGAASQATRAGGEDRARPTLVIWNPGAGGGESKDDQIAERRDAIQAALRANNLDAELYESASEADAARRVDAALAAGVSTIVAAGGDGTVRSIAFQLLDRDVALGILPMGTAMNVARSMDIPLELDGAVAVLAAGRTRVIDVGEARGRPFLEVASIGLGAEVLAGATEAGEGRFRIALATIRRAIGRPRTRVRLQLDGREVRSRAVSIAVANGRFTGRGIELAPQASLDDGRFDILLYESFGPFQLVADIVRVLLGRANDPRFRRYRAATVRISSHRALPVRLDSQDVGTTPVELVTHPGALQVIAPG
jgi:YegS/Rv2252/BmrU family lipid kinase